MFGTFKASRVGSVALQKPTFYVFQSFEKSQKDL